ncbi:hypothetical protein [Rubrivirga sp.]|uniref:hypothetical protein n=1 Tax=Rubrivirga sp. TaxID=1885344 RepID=UPI003C756AFA
MSQQTFSEDEAQRIFARAAQRQHAARPTGGALTLEELQAIGLEAGIEPAHIAAAVSESDVQPVPTWLGVPLRSRTVRHLDAPVTDAAWGRIVERLRAEKPTADEVETVGDRLIWTSNPGMPGHGARVTVVPSSDGATMTVESASASEPGIAMGLGAITAMCGLLGLAMMVFKPEKPGGTALALSMLVLFVLSTVIPILNFRRKAPARPADLDRLADDLARLAAPPSRPTPAPSVLEDDASGLEIDPPLVDLDAISDLEADSDSDLPSRDRVRS